MTTPSPSRVNYFDRQFLRRQDFADEQSYQIALRRRHNITHHTWGIVVGLEIALENGALVVRPGLAIDGYGRELLLTAAYPIDPIQFLHLGSNRLDVWLCYESSTGPKPLPGSISCNTTGSDNYYRTYETPRIDLARASPSRITRPKGVPEALLNLPVQLTTSDNPNDVWGIYLGRVTSVPEETDPQKQFLIDSSDRHYTGVLAEVIDHPGSGERLQLGPPGAKPEERQVGDATYVYRTGEGEDFAVFVPPLNGTIGRATLDPRFSINRNGKNLLRGTTSIHGNLQMTGGAIQFPNPGAPDQDMVRLHPCIYRASPRGAGPAIASTDGETTESADDLRIDLGTPVGTDNRKFVIGFTAEDGTFRPTVTIEYVTPPDGGDPQPLMTIDGDLKLNGLVHCQDLIERSLSKETLDVLLASFQAGSIAAGGQ